jgi:hypothetical protein
MRRNMKVLRQKKRNIDRPFAQPIEEQVSRFEAKEASLWNLDKVRMEISILNCNAAGRVLVRLCVEEVTDKLVLS